MLKLFPGKRKRHIFWDSATVITSEPEGTVTTWIPWIDNKLTWSQKEAFEKLWTPNYRLANTYISFLCETESNSGLGLGIKETGCLVGFLWIFCSKRIKIQVIQTYSDSLILCQHSECSCSCRTHIPSHVPPCYIVLSNKTQWLEGSCTFSWGPLASRICQSFHYWSSSIRSVTVPSWMGKS